MRIDARRANPAAGVAPTECTNDEHHQARARPRAGDPADSAAVPRQGDEYPSTFDFVNLEASAALTDRWSLTSVTGYSTLDLEQRFDGDLTEFDFLNVDARWASTTRSSREQA